MFVYRLICRPTRKVYVGTSEAYPEIKFITVPKEVQADFDNFGQDNFALFLICELNDLDKAIHKAEFMMEKEAVRYEIADEVIEEITEPDEEEPEPEYEVVEKIPEYFFEE